MDILIIEDDLFKYTKIAEVISDKLPELSLRRIDNIHDTINYIKNNTPDKIILDMSLPSHSPKAGEGSPLSMPSGGIEVILELRSLEKTNIPIIVITQYPEIEIDSEYYSISDSEKKIKETFGIKNLSVTYYENENDDWIFDAVKFLEN